MFKITPKISEKSVSLAKSGKFTLIVDKNLGKYEISKVIKRVFKVNPVSIRLVNIPDIKRKTARKTIVTERGSRKAIIELKTGEKMPGFESFLEEKKEKKNDKNK